MKTHLSLAVAFALAATAIPAAHAATLTVNQGGLVFGQLAAGTYTLDIFAEDGFEVGKSWSYSAGLSIYRQESGAPLTYNQHWNGTQLATAQLDHSILKKSPNNQVSFTLTTPGWVSFFMTHGTMRFDETSLLPPPVSAVPVPAAGGLLALALGGLAWIGRRKRAVKLAV